MATEYFRTLEAYDATRNTQAYYEGRAALHRQVAKLAQAGLVNVLEVDARAPGRSDVIVAQRRYEQALDHLKLTLGLSITAQFQIDVGLLDALRNTDSSSRTGPRRSGRDRLVRRDMADHADAVLDAQRAAMWPPTSCGWTCG